MEEIVEKAKNYSYSVKAVNVFNKLKKGTEYLEDSINLKVPKLIVKGNIVQDGEPTPDALVEIKTVKGSTIEDLEGNLLKIKSANINFLQDINFYNWVNNGNATQEKIDDYIKVIMPESLSNGAGIYLDTWSNAKKGDFGKETAYLVGKEVTYSFYARADKERKIYFQIGGYQSSMITLTTEWKRYSVKVSNFKNNGVPTFYNGSDTTGASYYIKDLMLKLGDLTEHELHQESSILIDLKKTDLFDYEKPTSYTNGLSYIKNDDGSFVASGTLTSTWANLSNNACLPTPLEAGIYTISHTNLVHNITVIFAFEDGTESSRYSLKGKNSIVATFEKVVTRARVFVESLTSGNAYTIEDDIKIYKGVSPDDAYELCQIGDIKDEIFLDKFTNKIIQRIGKVILNGSESGWSIFTHSGYGVTNFYNNSIIKFKEQKGYCDKLKVVVENGAWDHSENPKLVMFNSLSGIGIYFDTSEISTLGGFQTWLSEHPLTLYYPLATPIEIEQEVIELPYTYEDVTYISSNSEVEPEFEVDYYSKEIPNMNNLKVEVKEI